MRNALGAMLTGAWVTRNVLKNMLRTNNKICD